MNKQDRLSREDNLAIQNLATFQLKFANWNDKETGAGYQKVNDDNLVLYQLADYKGSRVKVNETHWFDFLTNNVYYFLYHRQPEKYTEGFKQYKGDFDHYQEYLKRLDNSKTITEFLEAEIGKGFGECGFEYNRKCPFCGYRTVVGFNEHYNFCAECATIWTNRSVEGECEHITSDSPIVSHPSWYESIRNSLAYVTEDDCCSVCNKKVKDDEGW